jgi:hypothetical protein
MKITFKLLAVITVAHFAILSATGYGEQTDAADFNGRWMLVDNTDNETQRLRQIDLRTTELPEFKRPMARKMLQQNTRPEPQIEIRISNGQLYLESETNSLSIGLGEAPIEINNKGKGGKVAARFEAPSLLLESDAKSGSRTTRYSLSEDLQQLTLEIRIETKIFQEPIVYKLKYQRMG